jgi:ABC-type phosphate transport system substrate-binding protein
MTSRPSVFIVCLAAAVLAVAFTRAQAQPTAPAYRIIINAGNADNSVDRKFVAQAFLKKTSTWSNGEAIRPVDLRPDSSVRRRFTEDVLARSVAAVRSYWQQLIFSGRGIPPPELDNDDEVVGYVSKHPGAIGYVSGGADIRNTRVLVMR